MGYKAIAHHRECYKLMVGDKEYKRRFINVRDANHAILKDETLKGKEVQIFYLPIGERPVLVDPYITAWR